MTEDEKREERVMQILLIIVALAVAATMLLFASTGYRECGIEGGTYVRTLLWFACIK